MMSIVNMMDAEAVWLLYSTANILRDPAVLLGQVTERCFT